MAEWIIDPDHTVAGFVVRHFMVGNVRGQFNKISGIIFFDPSDPLSSGVEAAIEVSSLWTGIAKRDEHLKSPDFFDLQQFPLIIFKSTSIEITGSNRAKLRGELFIHGITRPAELEVEYFGPIKSSDGETTIGFSATTEIDRQDFGITWNVDVEPNGFMVGKKVKITLDVEADLAVD
jgi:polyisoprenoid-binding protein YceI